MILRLNNGPIFYHHADYPLYLPIRWGDHQPTNMAHSAHVPQFVVEYALANLNGDMFGATLGSGQELPTDIQEFFPCVGWKMRMKGKPR